MARIRSSIAAEGQAVASGEREPAQQTSQRRDVDDMAAGEVPETKLPRTLISSGVGPKIAFSRVWRATTPTAAGTSTP